MEPAAGPPKSAEELEQVRVQLSKEKTSKRKLYSSLVKLAQELKKTRDEYNHLAEMASNPQAHPQMHRLMWYEGGVFRGPELLPGVNDNIAGELMSSQPSIHTTVTQPVSLSDLFVDMVIITSFNRVGTAIQDRGRIDGQTAMYFAIFWFMWGKEASYSTRFDTTDLTSQLCTLTTCFAILFGSLSTTSNFGEEGSMRIMGVAAFVACLHFVLHLRVLRWFHDAAPHSNILGVRDYALLIMVLTFLEACTWFVGIFFVPKTSPHQDVVFLLGILFSLRIPRTFLPNDFHAACSKRGVLFILLLGFLVQSMLMTAGPFFDYQSPNWQQYTFVGLVCFLLFTIKLLYVDDTFAIDPQDHALLINRWASCFFHAGQFTLLLSTTVLGAGLNLLTHSYLAATTALPDNAKFLVCGGFSGVVFSIAFVKSMHLRRVPVNPSHRSLILTAYGIQLVVVVAITATTMAMAIFHNGVFGYQFNEMQLLGVLSGLALLLWIISLLDEAVEYSIYGESDSRDCPVHPFGLWWFLKPGEPEPPLMNLPPRHMDHLSPLLSSSRLNIFDSQSMMYGSAES